MAHFHLTEKSSATVPLLVNRIVTLADWFLLTKSMHTTLSSVLISVCSKIPLEGCKR